MVLLAPKLLGISILDAAIMERSFFRGFSGSYLLPKMLKPMRGRIQCKEKEHPSDDSCRSIRFDDVFVIVMFTVHLD